MRRKLQLCLGCSKVFLLGLFSSLLAILIFFTITNNNNNNNFLSPFVAPDSNISFWTVIANDVVVPAGSHPNPHNYSYLLNNTDLCRTFERKKAKLLIFIESHIERHEARKQIRNTWGVRMLQTTLNFRIIFLLGHSASAGLLELVRQEYFLYGDILQESFPESFNNLGLKSVMGLKWSSTFCREADYVMKTDDDIFVHVPNLLKILTVGRYKPVIYGHRNRIRKIIRTEDPELERYKVRAQDMPGTTFPAYCAGFGYVMTMAAVHKLYKAALKTSYFFIEDVYITGFCRYKANVDIIDRSEFVLKPHLMPMQASCAFTEGRVTSHELEENELPLLWEQLNTQGYFCPRLIK